MKISHLKKLIKETDQQIRYDQVYLLYAKQTLINTLYESNWIWFGIPAISFFIGFHIRKLLWMRNWIFKIAKVKIIGFIESAII